MAMSKRMQRTVEAVRTKFPWIVSDANAEVIIRFVLKTWRNAAPRKKPEDDMSDIMNWSKDLAPLSDAALEQLAKLKPRAARQFVHESMMGNSEHHEFLISLPGRVLIKMAQHRLNVLKH